MTCWVKKTQIPLIMGVVNVTPDSFSDGGQFFDRNQAVGQAITLANEGADILDIGGESSRFGATAVFLEEEERRTIPVISALHAYFSKKSSKKSTNRPLLSIDTTKPQLAEKAIAAGARIVNDISSLSDDGMLDVLLKTGAAICLSHRQGTAQNMQINPTYDNDDPVPEVLTFLREKANLLVQSGVRPEKIAIDPGIGFGKTFEHNLKLIRSIKQFKQLGFPVLIGHSRKRFIGDCLGDLTRNRSVGTLALSLFLAKEGVDVLRVHEVRQHQELFHVWNTLENNPS